MPSLRRPRTLREEQQLYRPLDRIARAVVREIKRQDTTCYTLARNAGLDRGEVWFWLTGARNLRSDKVAAVLWALKLCVVPEDEWVSDRVRW